MSKGITTNTLKRMKQAGEKITCLTAYDASFARILEQQGVDVILVGDSLGMVIHVAVSTLSVSVNDTIYHAQIVSRVCERPMIVVDMPFMSYTTVAQAVGNAARLISEGGAQMVKLEGGQPILPIVEELDKQGVAVCGHLGLTPQSVHKLGGYGVQGKTREQYQQILQDAQALEQAGASLLVLECVPAVLAKEVTQSIEIPVIGIGAGVDCDGQVLVLHDMLGISNLAPRFSKNFMLEADSIPAAIAAYVDAVKTKVFPGPEQTMDD